MVSTDRPPPLIRVDSQLKVEDAGFGDRADQGIALAQPLQRNTAIELVDLKIEFGRPDGLVV